MNKPKVYVVNGKPGCGKTTFEDICCDCLGHLGFKISTVDFVKEVAKKCGWDGSKTLENRKFLSDLKDLLSKWDDVPYKRVKYFIESEMRYSDYLPLVFFIDVREPEEIRRFVEEMDAKTILIKREGAGVITSNHADADVEKYEDYDYIIYNDGDLRDLGLKVIDFLENEKIKPAGYFEVDLMGHIVRY